MRIYWIALVALLLAQACKAPKTAPLDEPGPMTREAFSISLSPEQFKVAGIKTGTVENAIITEFIECSGQIEVPPQNLISVHAPVTAFVRQVRFYPGDKVRKGDLLCVLEHPDFASLQRQFLESKAQLQFLETEYVRKSGLVEKDATSQREFESAQSERNREKATFDGLRTELKLMGFPVDAIESEGIIRTRLEIRSPANAYLTDVGINLGMLVHPEDLLYEMIDKSHLHLELQVYARDLSRVKPKQVITFTIPGNDSVFMAKVHLVNQMLDPESKTARVHGHLETESDSYKLTAGSYINGKIQVEGRETMSLPVSSIIEKAGTTWVFVREEKDFSLKRVSCGISDGKRIEILNADPGWEIVTEGAYYLQSLIPES
jgi:cobalt-zinc-cadmium efflux system membrane fusion protein